MPNNAKLNPQLFISNSIFLNLLKLSRKVILLKIAENRFSREFIFMNWISFLTETNSVLWQI